LKKIKNDVQIKLSR